MSETAIRVFDLGKQYRIGGAREPYKTFRDALAGAVTAPVRGVRALMSRNGHGAGAGENTFWALKDVNFEVKRGEVVGVIGRNGAGKSTLLKILSRITEPTEGGVDIYGRVGSLLEVGTGFHAELTGRENLYLSGAILGMRRSEIEKKFDEIVAFAEVEKFIDTPVKHYSSGMYLRLAFAVAAHLEPEILLVDEVLAVGDAAFQKKCLGKMGDVAKEGRTVLFVSHNMTAIHTLCSRSIWISEGRVVCDGEMNYVVNQYLKSGSENAGEQIWKDPQSAPGNEKVRLHAVRTLAKGQVRGEVDIDEEITIQVEFSVLTSNLKNLCANIYILNGLGTVVLSTANTPSANLLREEWFAEPHPAGMYRATCVIPANFLNEGQHYVNAYLVTLGPLRVEAAAEQAVAFSVFDTGGMREPGGGSRWDGTVRVRLPWQTEQVEQG